MFAKIIELLDGLQSTVGTEKVLTYIVEEFSLWVGLPLLIIVVVIAFQKLWLSPSEPTYRPPEKQYRQVKDRSRNEKGHIVTPPLRAKFAEPPKEQSKVVIYEGGKPVWRSAEIAGTTEQSSSQDSPDKIS